MRVDHFTQWINLHDYLGIKMEHETENAIESTELIREIYELTHEATIGNDPAVRLRLEELCKVAEFRGVM